MKATIRTNGTLVIIPETETEEYALSKWNSEQADKPKIVIDLKFTQPWQFSHTEKEKIEAFTQ